ncbi:MAG TPA: DNA replication/repair protein RecF [Gammaproteobacteria bacterium]|nr:DNA replication/repair protein RecF [Gammaproteobacteria bacterium]
MGLTRLSLRDFRCFEYAELTLSPGINLIRGANASGKTSVLEAAFLLGRGRSFRSAHLDPISRFNSAGFQVVGQLSTPAPTTIGLARTQGQLQVRLNGRPASGLAELAETFPVQIMDSQTHLLVGGGPRHRRQFLDWGVFHVEPAFFPVWRRYQRALRQRNALLRIGRPEREVHGWDAELILAGEQLDGFRRRYLDRFSETATHWAGQALDGLAIQLDYHPGWAAGQTLAESLSAGHVRDRQQGGTQSGPHRADLHIRVEGRPARERISRGQEKALAGTLLLAQTAIHGELTGRQSLLLLDDLPSELDPAFLARFVAQVQATRAQTILTAIDPGAVLRLTEARVFHVEQGKIAQMI